MVARGLHTASCSGAVGTRSSFGEQDEPGDPPHSVRPNSHGSCHVRTHRPGEKETPTTVVSLHSTALVHAKCTRPNNVSIHHVAGKRPVERK